MKRNLFEVYINKIFICITIFKNVLRVVMCRSWTSRLCEPALLAERWEPTRTCELVYKIKIIITIIWRQWRYCFKMLSWSAQTSELFVRLLSLFRYGAETSAELCLGHTWQPVWKPKESTLTDSKWAEPKDLTHH